MRPITSPTNRSLILAALLAAFSAVACGSADAASPTLYPSSPGAPSATPTPSNPDSPANGGGLAPPSTRISPPGASQPSSAPATVNPANPYSPAPPSQSPGPGAPYYQRETDPGPARRGDAYDVKPLYPR
jgi:hypothetical protein